MSAGAWLLKQRVLFLIRLERVSCGLGWESAATRRPPHSIKQTGFSLITGPWQCSNSLMCFKWARWNLGGVSGTGQAATRRQARPSLQIIGSSFQTLKIHFYWMIQTYVIAVPIAVWACLGVFPHHYLVNKAGATAYINSLLDKSRKMLRQIGCDATNLTPPVDISACVEKNKMFILFYYRIIVVWWVDFKWNKPPR